MAVYFLGPLCRRGHEHENTGQTLRRAIAGRSGGVCPKCATLARKRHNLNAMRGKKFKTDTYNGNPCRNGHGGLRYTKTKACVICAREYARLYNSGGGLISEISAIAISTIRLPKSGRAASQPASQPIPHRNQFKKFIGDRHPLIKKSKPPQERSLIRKTYADMVILFYWGTESLDALPGRSL